MTPEQFIALWKNNPLTERAGAQAHFDDLCDLLGVAKPRDPENYCFERGAKKAGGGDGWADVWKRGHFGWENKKPGRDLAAALKQLTDYALQLDNPPLLVVCDRERIVIHTAFTGYPDEPREIRIEQLAEPETRQLLRWVFTDPEKLRPEKSTAAITAEAAGQFAELAAAMRGRGRGRPASRPLPRPVPVLHVRRRRATAARTASSPTCSGTPAATPTRPPAASKNCSPPCRRAAANTATTTSPGSTAACSKRSIFRRSTATDLQPCTAPPPTWTGAPSTPPSSAPSSSAASTPLPAPRSAPTTPTPAPSPSSSTRWSANRSPPNGREQKPTSSAKAEESARPRYQTFLLRLNHFRVLDPACGSGNFLYLALKALRDIEKRAHVDAIELGLQPPLNMETGPHNILGLEINEFAAELARVTVWIGDIQWCRRNGYPHAINPILKPLDGIEHRDALLNPDGSEADWPAADVIVGNPPFLGGKVMRGELGDDYVETLRKTYDGRVPGGADLVTYWFEKARAQIAAGKLQAAGLVSTNSIRGGANRKVLERIVDTDAHFRSVERRGMGQ